MMNDAVPDFDGKLGLLESKWFYYTIASMVLVIAVCAFYPIPVGRWIRGPVAVSLGLAKEARISDSRVEHEIRRSLGKPAGMLTNRDVADLRFLELGQVETLQGIEQCQGLEKLHIESCRSLSGIEHLRDLRELQIGKLSGELPSLANLANLEVLNIDWNLIGKLEAIGSCTSLRELRWRGTIESLKPLQRLTNLRILQLDRSSVKVGQVIQNDLSPLSALTNLQELSLIGIADPDHTDSKLELNPLNALLKLRQVDLRENQIDDLTDLATMRELQVLLLENNEISDLSPLHGLTNLRVLYLDNNKIHDISALAGMTRLELLSLRNNRVRDLQPLKNLAALTLLCLERNEIQDVSALQALPKIGGRAKGSGWYLTEQQYPERWCWEYRRGGGRSRRVAGLNLFGNNISRIGPLVSNDGLGSGSNINLSNNPLDVAAREQHIATLLNRGVHVQFSQVEDSKQE